MRVKHALQNHRHHGRQRGQTLAVRCLHAIARAVVLQIVAHGGHQVVGAVATYRTLEAQLVGQSLLLNLAVSSQTDGTTLRESHAERAPVALHWQQRLALLGHLLVEFQAVLHAVNHLLCRHPLREVRVWNIFRHAIALIVRGDDDATAYVVGLFATQGVVVLTSRQEEQQVLLLRQLLRSSEAFVVVRNGDVAEDVQTLYAVSLLTAGGCPCKECRRQYRRLTRSTDRRVVERIDRTVAHLPDLSQRQRRLLSRFLCPGPLRHQQQDGHDPLHYFLHH